MDPLFVLGARSHETFLLVLARVGGLMLTAPILGHRAIPVLHRAGLAVLVAMVLTPALAPAPPAATGLALALAVALELVAGIVVGFIASLVIAAVQGAAELVALEMGLGIAASYDPAQGGSSNTLARFNETCALLIFLAASGHHVLLRTLAVSLRRMEPGAAAGAVSAGAVVALGGKVFRAGFELAAPLVGILFVVNVALALMARVAPQLNVFSVGLPVVLGIGFLGMIELTPHAANVVSRLITEVAGDIGTVLRGATRGL